MSRWHGQKPGTPLSPKQADVLLLMASGETFAEIGKELNCSQATANSHASVIRYKLRAKTNAHAVAIAYQKGILQAWNTSPSTTSPPPQTGT